MPTVTQSDITAIENWAGLYRTTIVGQVFQDLEIAKDSTLLQNLDAPMILPKYTAADGIRPFDSTVKVPSGLAGKFSQRTIVPRTAMKILEVIPEDLRKTYLGVDLRANAKEYPGGFAQYFWAQQSKKLRDEINRNAYSSIDPQTVLPFNPATAYAVGVNVTFGQDFFRTVAVTTAGQSPATTPLSFANINNQCLGAGYGTILAVELATMPASNKIATGVIDVTNAYDKYTAFFQSLPSEKQSLGGTFHVGYAEYFKYLTSLQNKFTGGTSFLTVAGTPGVTLYGSDGTWNVKPCSWMGSSKRIIATQKENLIMGTDLVSDMNTIGKMVETIHGYLCKFQFILAFQFVDLDLLYVNDQA